MTTYQNQVAVEATIAQAAWGRLFGAAMDAIAGCFARRETRATAAEMIAGLLAEVDTRNCWTLAEALGHPGPHRLQHLLRRHRYTGEISFFRCWSTASLGTPVVPLVLSQRRTGLHVRVPPLVRVSRSISGMKSQLGPVPARIG